jgi:hypothetical protein
MNGQETENEFENLKKEALKTALDIYKTNQNIHLKNFIKNIHKCTNKNELMGLLTIVDQSLFLNFHSSSLAKVSNAVDSQVDLDKVAKSDENKSHDSIEDPV